MYKMSTVYVVIKKTDTTDVKVYRTRPITFNESLYIIVQAPICDFDVNSYKQSQTFDGPIYGSRM
jgi:hypothetical protein